jgi:DNA helicase-2/ATP-dependent DNA helicase PcrA
MLNEKQQEAVQKISGPLLILAGAGAGKTKTIVERIIHIIKNGTEPRRILAITFTNKAAKEMRERILNRMGEEGMIEDAHDARRNFFYTPMIKTFHSLGMYILQEEYLRANLTKRLTIYDEADTLSLVKEILEGLNVDTKMHEPKRVRATISRLKSDLVDMEEYQKNAFSPYQKIVARAWPIYENTLKLKKIVDFDDLIIKVLKLLGENDDLREKYAKKWEYLHIDEYQDTNNSQYELCKLLVGPDKNVCAVGDVDQNIYSWRGANLKNLMNFEKDFGTLAHPAEMILLEQNYRSTKNIIFAANEIIKKNKVRREKNLFTENEEGEVITIYTGYDDVQEATFIAKKIQELLDSGINGSEISVLYRANFQSRAIEQALLAEKVPYHVLGVKFFDRKEVKDVLSYLKLSENLDSVEDLKRAISNPPRGFGKVTITKILAGKASELAPSAREKLQKFYEVLDKVKEYIDGSLPSEVILQIIKLSGIEEYYKEEGDEEALERLGNIYELMTLASDYDKYGVGEGMNKFLEDASLVSDQDTDTNEIEKVRLMTIHASKGLEFEYVFISGLEEDLFPSKKLSDRKLTPEESEEERRLFYVALTRARKKLFLTNAKSRMLFGKRSMQFRSEFLDDLPEGVYVEEEEYFDIDKGDEKVIVYI